MKEYIQYIIRFLLGDDIPGKVIPAVGYTDDQRQYSKYSIVIHPSGFFSNKTYGKPHSIPSLPLQQLDETPILFGELKEEMVDDTLVLYADLVASSYFLLTRYEEMVRRDLRDEHGRFPGKESLPYRAGFINRPIVEEYGLYLRNKIRQLGIRLPDEKRGIKKVYLTHDVDEPFFCRSWRSVVRETIRSRNLSAAVKNKMGKLESDPYYTFPWFFEENKKVRDILGEEKHKTICFFKAGGKGRQDKPAYNLKGKDMKSLFSLCNQYQVQIGLHSSYQAGIEPERIKKEKLHLETSTGKKTQINRHHYLSCREPEHMAFLQKAEINADYTLGYADIAGFRLGTCRPVRWINPATRKLSTLVLYPLTLMDCSLSETKYMNLSYEDALKYSLGLIEQTTRHRGNLVLLWHNTMFTANHPGYLKQLYSEILNKLTQI